MKPVEGPLSDGLIVSWLPNHLGESLFTLSTRSPDPAAEPVTYAIDA
jgi:hypothetical protein